MVNKTANAFRDLGVRIEDRVMMLLLDVPQFYAVFFGAVKIGAIPVPVNTMMTYEDYEYYLNDSRARCLAVSEELVPVINEIKGPLHYLRDLLVISETEGARIPFRQKYLRAPAMVKSARTNRDDAAFWLYSSGSTGSPKGAVHSQYDMIFASDAYARGVLELTEHDICYSAARLFFAYGLGNSMYFPMAMGAAAVLDPNRPRPESVFQNLVKFRPTVFFGVPTLYGQMLEWKAARDREEGADADPNGEHELSSVRICVSGGEALPTDIFNRWKARFGVEILDGIGSTEMLHIFISNRVGKVRPGSTGRTVPGYTCKIVDDEGNELPPGEIGTLLVKGDSAAQLYWHKREKSRRTMLGEWINTGDKYYVDEDGYYWCAGRSDDMLKVGGIWVSPVEVENTICSHPAVRECAVVGHPNDKQLIKPKAFVVLSQGNDPSPDLAEDIKSTCLAGMAKYKYPRWIVFVDELPKSATGKMQRYKLRE